MSSEQTVWATEWGHNKRPIGKDVQAYLPNRLVVLFFTDWYLATRSM